MVAWLAVRGNRAGPVARLTLAQTSGNFISTEGGDWRTTAEGSMDHGTSTTAPTDGAGKEDRADGEKASAETDGQTVAPASHHAPPLLLEGRTPVPCNAT